MVADRDVAGSWFEPLAASLADPRRCRSVLLAVPPGEDAKTLQVYRTLLHQLAAQEAHRDDVVVALGGGAAGDLAGFVAATYMRGMPFVQVPTTLTAQVDAAIGGKTAVNLPEGKNLVGAFHQPIAVLADVETLCLAVRARLPLRPGGGGEVRPHAGPRAAGPARARPGPVVAREPGPLEDLVARCVRAKARRRLPRTSATPAGRLILNYGHTLGHALERLDAFAGQHARRGDGHRDGLRGPAGRATRAVGRRPDRRARSAYSRRWAWRPAAPCRRSRP